jgi:hypothetical protein
MATWMIQDTDKKEETTKEGYKLLNAARNRNELFKDKPLVFVDDQGEVHKDVNNLTAARNAGLLGKENEAQGKLPFPRNHLNPVPQLPLIPEDCSFRRESTHPWPGDIATPISARTIRQLRPAPALPHAKRGLFYDLATNTSR